MKVAIACTGLDHIYRGFESFSAELYNSLEANDNIYLLKGSGVSKRNVYVLPTLKRTSQVYKLFPFNKLSDYYRYRHECLSFGYSLLPYLLQRKYDLIHFSDWILGDFLLDIRRNFKLNFKLLLSNGAPYEATYCNRFDAVQQIALSHYEEAISLGVPPEKMFLVPYGFDRQRLIKPQHFNQEEFRRQYCIPTNAFVILSLAALNYTHKRIDWLIKEVSLLDPENFYLVMAGQREAETLELENLARQLLPKKNYQLLTLPYNQIPALLWSSNLMVLCSMYEGFGRVLCEAMGARVPLIVHPHETAKWLIQCEDCFFDATKPGHLSEKIQIVFHNKDKQSNIIKQNEQRFQYNFEWSILRQSYLNMYEKMLNQTN